MALSLCGPVPSVGFAGVGNAWRSAAVSERNVVWSWVAVGVGFGMLGCCCVECELGCSVVCEVLGVVDVLWGVGLQLLWVLGCSCCLE